MSFKNQPAKGISVPPLFKKRSKMLPGSLQEKLKENSSNLKKGSSIVQVKFKQNSSKIQIKIEAFQYWRTFQPAQNFKNSNKVLSQPEVALHGNEKTRNSGPFIAKLFSIKHLHVHFRQRAPVRRGSVQHQGRPCSRSLRLLLPGGKFCPAHHRRRKRLQYLFLRCRAG